MIKKRIIIIDDESLILTLMKEIMEEDQELEISEVATEKEQFLNLVLHNSFDAALIDISVGGREGGLDILQILRDKGIYLPSIVLSAHEEIDYALKCLHSGAKGYVNKRYICTDLIRALKEIFCGNLFVSGRNGPYILNRYKLHDYSCVNEKY